MAVSSESLDLSSGGAQVAGQKAGGVISGHW